ncbi:thioredoxin domain-containing protein 5 homolog [Aricia agestis]|uniref:thioredoxin domain-containing protein 5 homolog n=1 Tax=Aricia agestis TaxID=91739 RepID=UPI001C203C3F|nr:thioredoxin domain-containing protein 5 homolog [Aricia agestis]
MNSAYTFIAMLLLPHIVTPEQSSVYEYGPEDFKRQIEILDGNFIMFYAPWCRHCTEFYPTWSELGEHINSRGTNFAIARVDCTKHARLCHEVDITGYPTLLFFHKKSFTPIEYKGARDLPSLSHFLNELFDESAKKSQLESEKIEVTTYGGRAFLNDNNIEKFVSKGQHFIMFYVPWCKVSQSLAPIWAKLAKVYEENPYIEIGQVNCIENEVTCRNFDVKEYPYLVWMVNGRIMGIANEHNLEGLKEYVEKMLLAENHDPDKFMKKKKAFPVARISEETFETFLQKELVFVNYFAPWCAHCMQLNPLWIKLGERFQNESRVIIADIDCGRSKTICEVEKINGLPTLVLYKNKEIVSVENGGQPLDSLISLVSEHLASDDAEESDAKQPTKDEL